MSERPVTAQESMAANEDRDRDDGAVLILALVVIIMATLIVIPMLKYASSVTRASRTTDQRVQRLEAVKGGLRTALSDPAALFKACGGVGVGVTAGNGRQLASPQLTIPVTTTCYLMDVNYTEDVNKRPYGIAAVQVGATLPAVFTTVPPRTDIYPGTGADGNNWRNNDTSVDRTKDKIWTPNLPLHAWRSLRSSDPYVMPPTFGSCLVYFPGTYVDPVNITSSTPVYFTSGVYYFENTVTVSGNAKVVVGGGGTEGCTTDQDAAFSAVNAPSVHNITGLGATFVFGMAGQLVVNNSTAGTGISLVFNQRYVDPTDPSTTPSASVNIMSVNGELPNSDLAQPLGDLVRAGVLSVPYSQVPTTGGAFGSATLDHYRPSTLVPPDPAIVPAPADTNPIVEVSLTAGTPTTVTVPGYVDVPQGRFLVSVPAGSGYGAASAINFAGGVLARKIEIPGDTAASFSVGVANVVSQLVLRITSVTTTGTPVVTSDAVVQVNQNGAYAVNNWSFG
jgi:hypothetical protein